MKTPARFSAALVAGVLTIGMGVATATAASATDSAPTTTVKVKDLTAERTRCVAAVDVRLATLAKLNASLTSAKNVPDAHRTVQSSNNANALSGLDALKIKIGADTQAATLAADCKSVFEDYRVFALRAPQTHLLIVGDTEAAAVTKLTALVPKLSDAIDKAGTAGKDVTAAKAALADLQSHLSDAATKASGIANSVIGYTPADYNANHSVLDSARANAKAVGADAKAARNDVKTIVTSLKA